MKKQSDASKKLLGYWSRTLKGKENNYDPTNREFLTIVRAVLLVGPYLEGQRLTIPTDHVARKWILNLANWTERLVRWRCRLSKFDFKVVHSLESKTKEQTQYCNLK